MKEQFLNTKRNIIILFMMLWSATQLFATDYYSNSTGNFTNPNVWGENADGGGTNPTAADFISGAHRFFINSGHTITLDDSVNCAAITINGTLTFGNSTEAKSLVTGNFVVQTGANVNVANLNAFHKLYVNGNFTNNGTVNLKNNSSQVVNVEFNGSFNLDENGTAIFNSITFKTGTRTVSKALNIEGSVIIEHGATFASQTSIIHTVAGNWIENGNGQITNGNINFDGTLVQSVSAATFEKLTFSKGGMVNFMGPVTVNQNFTITENTTVKSSHHLYLKGDFTVATGSAFEASVGHVFFQGTEEQRITLSDACKFYYVYFKNGSSTAKKIITGDAILGPTVVYDGAFVESTGKISFANGFVMQGKWNFNGQTVYLKGGSFYNNVGDNSFSFETSEVVVDGGITLGYRTIKSTMKVKNKLTVQSGTFTILDGSFLEYEGGASHTLSLKAGAVLQIYGENNFPTFPNYDFDKTSSVNYYRVGDQTVKGGINYGNLNFGNSGTKTADGNLTILSNMLIYHTTVDFSTFTHRLVGFIRDGTNRALGTIKSSPGGKFIFDGEGQYISRMEKLQFHDLEFRNSGKKDIYGDITLTGNFLGKNQKEGTSYMEIRLYDKKFVKDPANAGVATFALEGNVILTTPHTDNFNTMSNSFQMNLGKESIINFSGHHNVMQKVPGISYGSIYFWGNGRKELQGDIVLKKDFKSTGHTPLLIDNGHSINIAGNWGLSFANTPSPTSTVTFDGENQQVASSNFNNIVFSGSQTKSLIGHIKVKENLTINNSVTFDANKFVINIGGNWNNNGTGVFTQTEKGITVFDGVNKKQYINGNYSNEFASLTIQKTGTEKTLIANSDIDVNGSFTFVAAKGDFDLNGHTAKIGGNWTINAACNFTHNNGKLVFDGIAQTLSNNNPDTKYYDIEFKTPSSKHLVGNPFIIERNVLINEATVTADANLKVKGNWENAGTFHGRTNTVIFEGENQSISNSNFANLEIAGTETKTLTGNISCSGSIKINEGATLDVSENNHAINLFVNWTNHGYFNCRKGRVSFNGGPAEILTGGIQDGKAFYDLAINISYRDKRLTNTTNNSLKVLNDFVLDSKNGYAFYFFQNDIYVGGNFINNGANFHQYATSDTAKIVFTAQTGTYFIDFGKAHVLQSHIFINEGATYQMKNNFLMRGAKNLEIKKGRLELNGNSLTMSTGGKLLIKPEGGIEIDANASLQVADGESIINEGTFEIVGTSTAPAVLTSAGWFQYTQQGEKSRIKAKYFNISRLRGKGMYLKGGKIFPNYAFTEGLFSLASQASAYLTLEGINLTVNGNNLLATNTTFARENFAPRYNVESLSGSGTITFKNSAGGLAGEDFDNEATGQNRIIWEFPERITWDGEANDNNWHTALNWSNNTVPTEADEVLLDNSLLTNAYRVEIKDANVKVKKLSIVGNQNITLQLNTKELEIEKNIEISNKGIFEQTTNKDTLKVGGNFSNLGTYQHNSVGVVKFNPSAGDYKTINSTPAFYDFIVAADTLTTSLRLVSNIHVDNNVSLLSGTLSAPNRGHLYVKGDWEVNSEAKFDYGTSTVHFNGNSREQNISGGIFYSAYFEETTQKNILKNIDVKYIFEIQSGAKVNAGGNTVYMNYFRNYTGLDGFIQTGEGTAVFYSTGYIQGDKANEIATKFNHLIFEGRGNKYIYSHLTLTGNLIIKGSQVILEDNASIDGTATNDYFVMNAGTFYIAGEDNFPKNFKDINLNAGTVIYSRDGNQNIFPTTYSFLRLQKRNNNDIETTKTALGDITVLGDLNIMDNKTTLNMNNHTVYVAYGFTTKENGKQVIWGDNGSIVFNGPRYQAIDPNFYLFNNVRKIGGADLHVYKPIQLAGNFIIGEENGLLVANEANITSTGTNKRFVLSRGAYFSSYVEKEKGIGFPQNFTHNELDETSTARYLANGNQVIYTKNGTLVYGRLSVETPATTIATTEIDGILRVRNGFSAGHKNTTFIDNGHDMFIGGDYSVSSYDPTNTITFNGTKQTILNPDRTDRLRFNHLKTAGTNGVKQLYSYHPIEIKGNLHVGENDSLQAVIDMLFEGENFINDGHFYHSKNLIFMGNNQTINPGKKNIFTNLTFMNGGSKTFVENGIQKAIGTTFEITGGTKVDLGNLTHHIGIQRFTFNNPAEDSLLATQAYVNFNRGHFQWIPKLKVKTAEFSSSGTSYMTDTLWTEDIKINTGESFVLGDDTGATYPLYVYGNFENNANLISKEQTIFFESKDTEEKTITTSIRIHYNVNRFYKVKFNQTHTAKRTYKIVGETWIADRLTIGDGATLKLNGQKLHLGRNIYKAVHNEVHTIQDGGTLDVDADANLFFGGNVPNEEPSLIVENGATFRMVGTPGKFAKINPSGITYNIKIKNGATIQAKYYIIKGLYANGLEVESGAIIDPAFNFSDGIFSGIYAGVLEPSLQGRYYLNIDTDVSHIGTIKNVIFNHSSAVAPGTYFNVRRGNNAIGQIEFGGVIKGLLAGEKYEDEGSGASIEEGDIIWPQISFVTWTGNTSTDWFTASNWSPQQVPDETLDAVIPLVTNNPIINTSDTARCNKLEMVGGILTLETGHLKTKDDLSLGGLSTIAVANPNTSINVGKNWDAHNYSTFIHGGGTVKMILVNGEAYIIPGKTIFGNFEINGNGNFHLLSSMTIEKDFTLSKGVLLSNHGSYQIKIGGNFKRTNGELSLLKLGTIVFNGADQSIENAIFGTVKIEGTGVKTVKTHFEVGNLEISSTLKAGTNTSMIIKGDMLIKASGIFDDANQEHHFKGGNWKTENGATYSGQGTINFDGGTQLIHKASFHHLKITTRNKYLKGDIEVRGDLTMLTGPLGCSTHQITNTTGTGTFSMVSGDITVSGEDNYPKGFKKYLAEPATYQIYDRIGNQKIRGKATGSDPIIHYGNLVLRQSGTKTLVGDIIVKSDLKIEGKAQLDVSDRNYKINVGKYWQNSPEGIFFCRKGEVIFDAPITNETRISFKEGQNDFYKLTIKSKSAYTRVYPDLVVKNNLNVLGSFLTSYKTVTVYGDLVASEAGKFYNSGIYYLKKPSGTANLKSNGSVFSKMIIDAGKETQYKLLDDYKNNGFLEIKSGIFDGNGKTAWLSNTNLWGTYKIGSGGALKMYQYKSFSVLKGGVFEALGEQGNVVNITSENPAHKYNFSVESGGTIKAEYYKFENMGFNGIYLKGGSIIDQEKHFSRGAFANPTTGGTCLRIENEQNFSGANRIEDVDFIGGNGSNVMKTSSTIGDIDFYNARGSLSGEKYDEDPNDLISWTGAVVLTWTGAHDNNWFDARNWKANIGPNKIPTIEDRVIIEKRLNQPQITKNGAAAKSIDIKVFATLTVRSEETADTTLTVKENFVNQGTFSMAYPTDIVSVGGNWISEGYANFYPGEGTVVLKAFSGLNILNLQLGKFYRLVIDVVGTMQLARSLSVEKELVILNGKLDVLTHKINIEGDFINKATFEPRNGEVIFNSEKAGTNKINIGNSNFYRLTLKAHKDAVYLLEKNTVVSDDVTLQGGTLQLNAKELSVGSSIRNNIISIENNSILYIDGGAQLKMHNGSKVEVKNKGVLKMLGQNNNNLATITHKESGMYGIVLNAGGKLIANYYDVSYINEEGIHFKVDATLDATNNLSNGFFSNGQLGGQYLWFENNLPTNFIIRKVIFNSGASINTKRTTGTNPINFEDAFGLRGGYLYEQDEETTKSATSGLVRWRYTEPIVIWTGEDYLNNVNWNNTQNWSPNRIPNSNDNVFIPDVADGRDPILQTTNGEAMNISIYEGGKLTIKNNYNLNITKNLSGAGKIIVEDGSNSTIKVGENWDNLGVFQHGGSSTVCFVKETGIIDINPGNNAFYNIEFNSSNSAVFRTLNKFDVDGDFTVQANTTFKITSATHTLNIGGNFTNKGTFDVGTTTVTFDGSGNQSISKTTSGSQVFSKIVFAGTGGEKSFVGDMKILKEILIQENNTLKGGSSNIYLLGDWINNGNFVPETSSVIFEGNTMQSILKQGIEEFYNLKINNLTKATAVKIETDVNIKNELNLTDGILETSHSSFLNILAKATVVNASEESYVSGPMRKIGKSDFVFPVGKGSVYARLEILNLGKENSTFQVEYLDEAPSNRTAVEEPLSEISLVEHWNLERKAGTATPEVKLYFADSIRSKIEKMRDVVVAVYDKTTVPNMWKSKGKKPATRVGKGGWVKSEQGISDFGRISIGFEYPTAVWTGNTDSDWHTASNWDWGDGYTGVPNQKVNVEIPTATNQPIISKNNATSYNLKIENGATLTINSNKNLEMVGRGSILAGGTLAIADGSNSEVIVNKTFENSGTFTPGNASTVTYARIEKQEITLSKFHHLTIGGKDKKIFKNNILVTGNLTINSILEGGSAEITLMGNWINNGQFYRNNSKIKLTGTSQQTIKKGGNGEIFYDLIIANTSKTKSQIVLQGNVTVDHQLVMNKGKILSNNSSLLSLSQGATVTNDSKDSYVVGPMRKFGTNDFVFPIGRDSVYARIALTKLTGNAVFVAEYFIGSPENRDTMDNDIKAVSAVEYWTVKRTNPYNANVTLYYEDSARSRIANPDSLRVVHYNGTLWQDEGNNGNAGRRKAGWVKSGQFSSFSPITFGTINENDPLPIELTRFEANVVEKVVKLDWETATEKNNDYFTIERTTDGKNITQIAKIKGVGNSFSPSYYTFIDKKPEQGISYYRLKQTDFDGKSETFNWLSVIFDAPIAYDDLLVELYPNPGKLAEMKVKIKTEQDKEVGVEIVNMLGKRILLHHLSINKGEEYELELSKLKLEQGIYLLNIVADKKQKQIKFIVK